MASFKTTLFFYKNNYKNTSLKLVKKLRTNFEQTGADLLQNEIWSKVFSQNRGFLACVGAFSVNI